MKEIQFLGKDNQSCTTTSCNGGGNFHDFKLEEGEYKKDSGLLSLGFILGKL